MRRKANKESLEECQPLVIDDDLRDEISAPQPRRRFWSRLFQRREATMKSGPARLTRMESVRMKPIRRIFHKEARLSATETLTQRYMRSDYDKLMDDVEAIPFYLHVDEVSTIRSRVSKLLSTWSPTKSATKGEIEDQWNPYINAKGEGSWQSLASSSISTSTSTSGAGHESLGDTVTDPTPTFSAGTFVKNGKPGLEQSSRFGSLKRRISLAIRRRKVHHVADEDEEDEEDEETGTVVIRSCGASSTTLLLQEMFTDSILSQQLRKESMFSALSSLTLSGSTKVSDHPASADRSTGTEISVTESRVTELKTLTSILSLSQRIELLQKSSVVSTPEVPPADILEKRPRTADESLDRGKLEIEELKQMIKQNNLYHYKVINTVPPMTR